MLADMTGAPFIALWAVIYVALVVTLGVMSLRKGHWLWFLLGFFFPFCWLIGALLPRRRY